MNPILEACKQRGDLILLKIVVPANPESRDAARKLIRQGLDTFNISEDKRRFVADYCMAQLGYGGGF